MKQNRLLTLIVAALLALGMQAVAFADSEIPDGDPNTISADSAEDMDETPDEGVREPEDVLEPEPEPELQPGESTDPTEKNPDTGTGFGMAGAAVLAVISGGAVYLLRRKRTD